ncbi:hypothetical protein [Hyphomicrobium sp. DY-1]|uniref:hypothetical protein n=1 Tax=Hyphomicrobium sp. DY-1 TaxID=3075650 RepID=UPI0039C21B1A
MRNTHKLINESIAAGQKNQRALMLINNWCRHAKVKKFGGTGLIEMETGLPIGHHSIECPHAPADGMSMWDLGEAAVDFYDRNCVDCKHRAAVRFPNISELVVTRDKENAEQQLRNARYESDRLAELAKRDADRRLIRAKLTVVQAAILDQLAELDHNPSDDKVAAIMETARLAPEHFSPEVQQHLLSLIDVGGHRAAAGLPVLDILGAQPSVVGNAALKSLARYDGREIAAELAEKHAQAVDSGFVEPALSALTNHAYPREYMMIGGMRREKRPGPLLRIYEHHPDAVQRGILKMLDSHSADDVEEAARVIISIGGANPAFSVKFASTLIAKIIRAKYLLEGLDDHDFEKAAIIRNAIVDAFLHSPKDVDALIQSYLLGADDEGRAAALEIYEWALRDLRFTNGNVTPKEAHEIAFRRLIWAATEIEGEEALDSLQSAFSRDLYDLKPLAIREIDSLLGTAAILDDKLNKLEEPTLLQDPRPAQLVAMDRWHRRSGLTYLRDTCIRWACQAAGSAGLEDIEKVVVFLRAQPETRVELVGVIIGNLPEIARSAEKLSAILPDLYGAMVSGSQLLRSYAATAIGELSGRRTKDLPDLVFQAFLPLLSDPYVIVHKAALHALERFFLPTDLEREQARALADLVNVYNKSRSDDRFLLQCLELYCDRCRKPEDLQGRLGDTVMSILLGLESSVISRDIHYWARRLLSHVKYPQLLIKLLDDREIGSNRTNELLELFINIPFDVVKTSLDEIKNFGLREASRSYSLAIFAIELLSLAGAWAEAAHVARAAYEGIEDTTANKQLKLSAELRMLAAEYEAVIANNKTEELDTLAQRWRKVRKERETDYETNKQRRDPMRGFLHKN